MVGITAGTRLGPAKSVATRTALMLYVIEGGDAERNPATTPCPDQEHYQEENPCDETNVHLCLSCASLTASMASNNAWL